MYRIVRNEHYLTERRTWTTNKEDAEVHATYEDAKMLSHLGIIEADNLPCFILTGLHEDDTLTVICHWHVRPDQNEIDDMIDLCAHDYVCLNLSEVTSIHTGKEH